MHSSQTPAIAEDKAQASALVCGILRALVAKLNLSLADVDEAVTQLGEAFEDMSSGACALSAGDTQTNRDSEKKAMQALQFHDRLDQRLQHVSRALLQIASQLDSGLLESRDWKTLAHELSEACPVESDKELFDKLLGQASPPSITSREESTPRGAGDVELF